MLWKAVNMRRKESPRKKRLRWRVDTEEATSPQSILPPTDP